jgi:DMSO/TMAO reductase YedYZ molybdopterin-dependent catalytic subunit
MSLRITRRRVLTGSAALGAGLLTGCDGRTSAAPIRRLLDLGQLLSLHGQRLLLAAQPLVREYSTADISPDFPPNGTEMPDGPDYFRMATSQFASWRLVIDGLVRNRLSLSLAELRTLPARTQITMHSCDEGWSAIGQWTGVQLSHLLQTADLAPQARYVVFHCLDQIQDSAFYYESIDLFDAFHPQTILAYGMNGRDLPVAHGAPLRLRVERQIGYKHAKYIGRIEAVEKLDNFGLGRGGYWPDRGFQWYAGL